MDHAIPQEAGPVARALHATPRHIGALAASITSNIQKSLDKLQTTPLKQVTIEADEGKLFFSDAGMGILVVTTEKMVNIGLIRLEIKNAINKLKVGV